MNSMKTVKVHIYHQFLICHVNDKQVNNSKSVLIGLGYRQRATRRVNDLGMYSTKSTITEILGQCKT